MHQRPFLGGGWTRGGASEVVRRAHPASGAQWNVQVVRGKVNGKCLWNACKALSLGLLLMILGAAMATIGYYADHLSIAQEVRGNHTVHVKNESRGFHLNNLSYAGPIVMGVGGFIVVAACVMTFEARDSAAKVVPARLKMSTSSAGPAAGGSHRGHAPMHPHTHGSMRTSGSQTGSFHHQLPTTHVHHHGHGHVHGARAVPDRRAITESFMSFSKNLAIKSQGKTSSLKIPHQQGSINKSPSAPNLVLERQLSSTSQDQSPSPTKNCNTYKTGKPCSKASRTLGHCALLNAGLLHRHALSVDETAANNYRHHDSSLQGSQSSLAMDLHLECPITLRIHDRRRNPLMRQRKVEEDEHHGFHQENSSRRSSHSCSPRLPPGQQNLKDFRSASGGSSSQLRRSSNASDCSHRSRGKNRDFPHTSRGRLERAISSDSRLTGALPKTHRLNSPTHRNSGHREPGECSSDTDIRRMHPHSVHFCKNNVNLKRH